MTEKKAIPAEQYSPLTLAFLGDAVYELEIRRQLCLAGSAPAGVLHRRSTHYVCAAFQAQLYDRIETQLTPAELSVLRRGRNASGAAVPKSATPAQYRKATGVEALMGYLYLEGNLVRIAQLCSLAFTKIE